VQKQLKLDLASYREYEAFAQFASDLDDTTKRILRRGSRMVELLKQAQYAPMNLTDQEIMVFAGQEVFLDELELDDVLEVEEQMVRFARERYPDLVARIEQTQEFTDEDAEQLTAALTDFAERRAAGTLGLGEEERDEAPSEADTPDEAE